MPSIAVPERSGSSPEPSAPEPPPPGQRIVADGALLLAFLGLTFLLGVFPMKVVDIWWHLRTGDLIRAEGTVPRTDWYTYTVPDHEWVDLHWGFQVAASWLYERAEVNGLILAKCAISTLAVGLLITSRKRSWPLWVMALAWLPGLVLLGGRMYVRPETVSLLFIAGYLAILFRWQRWPWLGLLLPVLQALWVNVQGLFIFGPFFVGLALVDAAIRPNAFAPERRRWWKIALTVAVLTGLACLVNPYGFRGALFPITDLLFGTMSHDIFKQEIAELSSIQKLRQETAGFPLFMLQVHYTVALLGALSFLVPILWRVTIGRPGTSQATEPTEQARKPKKKTKKSKQPQKKRSKSKGTQALQSPDSDVPGLLFRGLL